MRERLIIIIGLFILIAILIGLNAASYTQKEKLPDSEMIPNRSTFNGGATGSRAFFDLLNETGRKPVRWTEPPSELERKNSPTTFVIIGEVRQSYTDSEVESLLRWVSQGRRLVVIDRHPPETLAKTTANYEISHEGYERPFFDTDAYDQSQMTIATNAAKPSLPTVFTRGVIAVQPSRFATSIEVRRLKSPETATPVYDGSGLGDGERYDSEKPERATKNDGSDSEEPEFTIAPTPKPSVIRIRKAKEFEVPELPKSPTMSEPTPDPFNPQDGDDYVPVDPERFETKSSALTAPAIHFANDKKNIVVDVPYGSGQIVYLSDPYVVSNAGISIADNSALAINLVGLGGTVAFDEYHQGYGSNRNRFFEFFAGTPVVPIFLQLVLVVGLLFYSRSRRFARPVPEPEPNRLSKLEYVSAMAELQQRTKGYDLAIENIYTDFRRRVARLVGIDNRTTPRHNLALLIAERIDDENAVELEALMKRCEDVMHGDRTGKQEVLRLTTRLREIEEKLGLLRRKRVSGER